MCPPPFFKHTQTHHTHTHTWSNPLDTVFSLVFCCVCVFFSLCTFTFLIWFLIIYSNPWNEKKKRWCAHFKAGPPLEAILVIFGRRALIFFLFESSWKKMKKWHHFCAHAQWWSPWRRKNVEKGHLAPSNLTFLIIAIDRNGFRRMKEEGWSTKVASDFLIFA